MRRRAAGDGPVDVVADQIGSPTYVGDLAGALLQVADGGIREPLLHAANQGAVSRFEQAQAVFEEVGADPERVRPVGTDRHPRPAPRPAYSALSGRQSAAAGLTPLRPWRDALAAAMRNDATATLYAVSDELVVVTVTYSPGPHLDRFLASLSHATDRPVTVIMADNGSTDGAPEEALERYPNVRLLRTGANLGYGTAVNRAVAEYLARSARSFSSSPTPMCSGVRAASTCCWKRPRGGPERVRWGR